MSETDVKECLEDDEGQLFEEALELRRSILCIICLEVYCDPVILPCSHTFCRNCIEESSRRRPRCPICSSDFLKRSIITGTHIFKVVEKISSLIDSLTNVVRYSVPLQTLDERLRTQRIDSALNVRECNAYAQPYIPSNFASYDGRTKSQVQDSIELQDQQIFPPTTFNAICATVLDSANGGQASINAVDDKVDVDTGNLELKQAIGIRELEKPPQQNNESLNGASLVVVPSSVQISANGTAPTTTTVRRIGLFRPGEVVQVTSRTWPGVNKPGGAAWVLAVHERRIEADPNDIVFAYDLKYVLHGNSDYNVSAEFVEPIRELDRNSRKRGLSPVINTTPVKRAGDGVLKLDAMASLSCLLPDSYQNISDEGVIEERIKKVIPKIVKNSSCIGKNLSTSARSQAGDNKFHGERFLSHRRNKENIFSNKYILPTSLDDTDFLKLTKFIEAFSLHTISSSTSSSSSSCSLSSPLLFDSQRNSGQNNPDAKHPFVGLTQKFDETVTHVVVTVDKRGTLKKRTLKFMQAIMAGIWIVSPKWLSDSLQAGEILDEDNYEVLRCQKAIIDFAPKRARLAVRNTKRACDGNIVTIPTLINTNNDERKSGTNHLSSFQNNDIIKNCTDQSFQPISNESINGLLFSNTIFLLFGSFPNSGPPRNQIAELLSTGEAHVVTSIKALHDHNRFRMLTSNQTHRITKLYYQKIVICTDKLSILVFLKELKNYYSQENEIENSNLQADKNSIGKNKIRISKINLETFLRVSNKYPIEDHSSYMPLISEINALSENLLQQRLKKKNVNTIDGNEFIHRLDENKSEDGTNDWKLQEIIILNPTWIFDSIANYSLMLTL